jgi:AraC-like DNA-binding protein
MKVLQFTIPVPHDKTIIVQEDVLPYFYPHLHRHHEIQLTWIKQGDGTLVADNNMLPFRSNDIFCLGANQPHVFKSDPSYFNPESDKQITAFSIFFNPNASLKSLFELPEIKKVKNFLEQYSNGFIIPKEHAGELSAKMIQVENSTGIDQLIYFIDLLKQMASMPNLAPLSTSVKPKEVSDYEGMRLGSIYDYIMQQYDKQVSLDDVAKVAHMTPQAFCRYFKKHTLHTFVSFLNEIRINEACKKFMDGHHDSISTVAYNCGFNSITNFNRVFKTIRGISPSEYVSSYARKVENAYAN